MTITKIRNCVKVRKAGEIKSNAKEDGRRLDNKKERKAEEKMMTTEKQH